MDETKSVMSPAFDGAMWLVRSMREPLGLTLQESLEWMAVAAALLNGRLHQSKSVLIIKRAGLFGDANGVLEELAATRQYGLQRIVQALPDGFLLEVSSEQALIQWFDLRSGQTICLDNAVAVRPE